MVNCYHNRIGTIRVGNQGVYHHRDGSPYYYIIVDGILKPAKKKTSGAIAYVDYRNKNNSKWTGLRYDLGTRFVQTDAPYTPTPGTEQIACTAMRGKKKAKIMFNVGS